MSVDTVLGYEKVEKLYLQLLYSCNFRCKHCFHGAMLDSAAQLTCDEVRSITSHFAEVYGTRQVVLLGGEPFLHPEFVEIASSCFEEGLFVETCTNGHRFTHRLIPKVAGFLGLLRVSIDGLKVEHDSIRRRGSFANALESLDIAQACGIDTGVTTTVTAMNIGDVPSLAEAVAAKGARELRLHQLRLVGNAAESRLDLASHVQVSRLAVWLRDSSSHPLRVVFDDELMPESERSVLSPESNGGGTLERIELDPDGGLTMSCKAVGLKAQAFYWSRETGQIISNRSATDEISVAVPNVRYVG